MNTRETAPQITKRKRLITSAAAVSIFAAGGVVGGAVVHANEQGPTKNASAEANATAAFTEAKQLEHTLNDSYDNHGHVDGLKVWQGVITRRSANGWAPAYSDPIILAVGHGSKKGPSSDPSSPSYIGVISGTPKSGIVVTPLEFTDDYQFGAAAPDAQVERTVSAYTTMIGDGIGLEVIAYDPQGNNAQVTHPYGGGLITPGFQIQ